MTSGGVALPCLPGLGRDVSTFVTLQPGWLPTAASRVLTKIRTLSSSMAAITPGDMDGAQNTYTPSFAGDPSGGVVNSYVTVTAVSGAPGGGGPSGVMPTPVDSIEEFSVGTTNQTADFNSSAGAQCRW